MPARVIMFLLWAAAACSHTKTEDTRASTSPKPGASEFRATYQLPNAEPAASESAFAILRARAEDLPGAPQLSLQNGKVLVVAAGGLDAETKHVLHALMTRQGILEIKQVASGSEFMTQLCESVRSDSKASVMKIETALDTWQGPDGEIHRDCYLSASDRSAMLTPEEAEVEGCQAHSTSERSLCVVSGRTILARYLSDRSDILLPSGFELAYEAAMSSELNGDSGERFWRTYYLHSASDINTRMIEDVQMTDEGDDLMLQIRFDEGAQKVLHILTQSTLGGKLGILVDNTIYMAPVVQSEISGGRLAIDLGPGVSRELDVEAKILERLLKHGSLPAAPMLLPAQP